MTLIEGAVSMSDRRTFLKALAATGAVSLLPDQHALRSEHDTPQCELPGLKLPRAFELALLRGNAEKLFPKFKAKT
jgi:hypothetical protein